MLLLGVAMVVAAPTLLDDAPAGTDLVIRADAGALAGEATKMWEDAQKLVDAWPQLRSLRDTAQASYDEWAAPPLRQLGVDFRRQGAVLTLVVDLDATGGTVYSVVLRGVGKSAKLGEGATPFTVDAAPAYRHPERDLAWAQVKDAFVWGNERGVQRQLRHLLAVRRRSEPALSSLAEHLRKPTPFALAYVAPAATRAELAQGILTVGPFLGEVASAVITAKPGNVELRLQAANAKGEEALLHGMRALVAAMRGVVGLLEGGGEMMLGLDELGRRPENAPPALEAEVVESLVTTWLGGFALTAAVRQRSEHRVEVSLKVSGFRALLAAAGILAGAFLTERPVAADPEVQALLVALREAELAYKRAHGQFLVCGPVPAEPPQGETAWPAQSCLDPLGFRPPKPVRWQVAAAVKEGALMLMARGDSDGDGVAEMWMLDEKSASPRRFGPPSSSSPPPPRGEKKTESGGLKPAN